MAEHYNLPVFIGVGAMKAGTTTLQHYLMEHPNISFVRIKFGNIKKISPTINMN